MPAPTLVTAALPYASGPPHFGHLVGAYLPADVYVRYLRLLGREVAFICGTDEHGVAITLEAERQGVGYQAFVDRWHRVWQESFTRLGIEFDNFSQTSRKDPHYPLSQEFFLRLLQNGRLKRKETKQLYSPKTGRFLADRYVRGRCYRCGHEEARGDECPSCGAWLESGKLGDPRSALDPDDKLELRDAWQYEIDLSPFKDDPAIRPWLDGLRKRLKPNVSAFVFEKMIEGEGLESRPITRDLPWGVPLPEKDLGGQALGDVSGKVLYVWFDAPIGYLSSTIEWARRNNEDWRRWWIRKRGEEGCRLIHFIAKDNIPFHCILFPAMLAWQTLDDDFEGRIGPGPGEEYVLAHNVPANEFFNLEGRKFNKSEGWSVDVDEFLGRDDADLARYYLCSAIPETADSDFLWRELKVKTDELANVFGNFAVRVLKFVAQHFQNRVPPRVGLIGEAARVADAIEVRTEAVQKELDAFRFRKALAAFRDLAGDGNHFLDRTRPWKLRRTDPPACGGVLNLALRFLPPLSVLAAPFVPGLAARLRGMLNLPPREPGPLLPAETLEPGHELGKAEVLCEKIPDERIAAEIAALRARADSQG
ncbi:MAG: methionine--tRNA ligase [Planctomycetota bacterium]